MRLSFIICVLLVNAILIQAQFKGLESFDMDNMMKTDALDQMNTEQFMRTNLMPLGNMVEATKYYVGPGDVFQIQNITTLTQKDLTMVTPENTVMIPRMGEVDLKGKTLEEARILIIQKIKENTKDAVVYVSLYKPRNILIEVSGNVVNPGIFTFPATFRVSTAFKYASQQKMNDLTFMQKNSLYLEKLEKNLIMNELITSSGLPYTSVFSNRNIIVYHSDGKVDIADFEKSNAMNTIDFDPYLKEGDRIFVPFETTDFPMITIAGSVIRPYVTAFKKGDMASMLLKFGGGLREDADWEKTKLILPVSGREINLNIDEKLALLGEDYELEPGSVIIVGKKKFDNSRDKGVVSIIGEVEKPGIYPIIPNKTTVKEAMTFAGGFSKDAYLPLAYIIRRDEQISDHKDYKHKFMEKFQYSNLTQYDTTRFKMDVILRQPKVSCDFPAIFEQNKESSNVILQDGDIIKIPKNPKTVYVFGQVKNPGYIKFEENKNMEWYIKMAGGFNDNAEKSSSRIIRAGKNDWIEGGDKVFLFAGDEIYVPAPPYIPEEVKSQTWALIVASIGAAANLASVLYFIISSN